MLDLIALQEAERFYHSCKYAAVAEIGWNPRYVLV